MHKNINKLHEKLSVSNDDNNIFPSTVKKVHKHEILQNFFPTSSSQGKDSTNVLIFTLFRRNIRSFPVSLLTDLHTYYCIPFQLSRKENHFFVDSVCA